MSPEAARPGKTPDRSIRKTVGDYKVTGRHYVLGKPPGSIVHVELPTGAFQALVEGGHLSEVPKPVEVEQKQAPTIIHASDSGGAVENHTP